METRTDPRPLDANLKYSQLQSKASYPPTTQWVCVRITEADTHSLGAKQSRRRRKRRTKKCVNWRVNTTERLFHRGDGSASWPLPPPPQRVWDSRRGCKRDACLSPKKTLYNSKIHETVRSLLWVPPSKPPKPICIACHPFGPRRIRYFSGKSFNYIRDDYFVFVGS